MPLKDTRGLCCLSLALSPAKMIIHKIINTYRINENNYNKATFISPGYLWRAMNKFHHVQLASDRLWLSTQEKVFSCPTTQSLYLLYLCSCKTIKVMIPLGSS